MTTQAQGDARTRMQSLRVLSFAFIGMLPVLALVAVLVLGLDTYPSAVLAAALFALNLLAFGLAEAIGYRAPAVPAGTEPDAALQQGLTALQQTTTVRLAITEAPALVGLATAFATGSAWPYLISAFWAALSMAWHGWPHRRAVAKVQRSLDRSGGRSGLMRVIDGSPTVERF